MTEPKLFKKTNFTLYVEFLSNLDRTGIFAYLNSKMHYFLFVFFVTIIFIVVRK